MSNEDPSPSELADGVHRLLREQPIKYSRGVAKDQDMSTAELASRLSAPEERVKDAIASLMKDGKVMEWT